MDLQQISCPRGNRPAIASAGPLALLGSAVPACPVCRLPAPWSRPRRRSAGELLGGWLGTDRPCRSCRAVSLQLGGDLVPVAPVSIGWADGGNGSGLYSVLRRYKWHETAGHLRPFREVVAAALAGFLARHAACIIAARGTWDVVTHVPSTSGRPGLHPLERTLRSSMLLSVRQRSLLAPGTARLDHHIASPDGFRVTARVDGLRVLVVDDTYVSGARAQSAAASLRAAGAHVVSIVALCRVMERSTANLPVVRKVVSTSDGSGWDVCPYEAEEALYGQEAA